jgi:ABC-type Na+ efflux pump permease subunit
MSDARLSSGPPARNKLILPSLILGCIPVLVIPITLIFPSTQFYLFFFLPFGLAAALLARIALNQMKHGPYASQDRVLAVVAYFLGLSPALYFCAELSYQLMNLN